MKAALDKVRKALSRLDKSVSLHLTHYLVRDGMIHATDGRITAAAPFPYDGGTFAVMGEDFERVIDRMPTRPTLTQGTDHIVLKCGRLRGTIQTLIQGSVQIDTPQEGSWEAMPPGFFKALERIRPFVSDNATHYWALCVCLGADRMLATTNVALAAAECEGLQGKGQMMPCWAVDYLLSRSETLIGIQLHENNCEFLWTDGSWMRTQLIGEQFPETASKLLDNWRQPEHAVTDAWRAAYRTVADMAEREIEIHADRILGRSGVSVIEHEIASPTPDKHPFSKWDPRYLNPVIDAATHWSPALWPSPCYFGGEGIRGIVMGRR